MLGLDDDENVVEMMAMWPVSGGDWIMMAPSGELAVVDMDALAFGEIFSGDYPEYDESKGLEQFQVPLEDEEVRAHVAVAQRQAAAARGGRPTPDFPTRTLGWNGRSLAGSTSSGSGLGARLRDSVAFPGVPPRRVVGRSPPGGEEGRVLTGPYHGDSGQVWVVSEPGHASAFGVVVRPGRGSIVLKNRGVYLHLSGEAIPISRIQQDDLTRYQASQIALFAAEDRGAGVGLPPGGRAPALRRAVVDLRALAEPEDAGGRRRSLEARLGGSLPLADDEADEPPDDEAAAEDSLGGGGRGGTGRGRGGGGGDGGGSGGPAGAAGSGGAAAPGGGEDVRVLEVDYDSQGARFKEWREVCNESKVHTYEDFPLDGPISSVKVFRHMERFGGNPKSWLDRYLHNKSLKEGDRNLHELEVLCEALFHFGSYDQLNAGASACAEVLVRRVFSIVDALSAGADRASWHNAAYYMGGTSADDLVPMEMKNFISRRAKEDNEVGRHRAPYARGGFGVDAAGGSAQAAVRSGLAPPGTQPNAEVSPKGKKGGKRDKGAGRAGAP